jgi:uncharacterized protein (TIGR04222 family)
VNTAIVMIVAEMAWLGGWEAFMLWSRWRSADVALPDGDGVTDYETAYLAGGARRVVQCALVHLYTDGRIELSSSRGRLRTARHEPQDPVEAAVLNKLGSASWPVQSLTRVVAAAPAVDEVRTRLVTKRRFIPGVSSRALALTGPAGLLVLAGASIPIVLAAQSPLPWLPGTAGLLLLVATARLPGPRPTLRGRLVLLRLRRATTDGDASPVALRGAAALDEDDPRRSLCPAPPLRPRRSRGPCEWDPDSGHDAADRFLLRDLGSLVRFGHDGGLYSIEGNSAFWSDGGHHDSGGGDWSGGDWGGGDGSGHHG